MPKRDSDDQPAATAVTPPTQPLSAQETYEQPADKAGRDLGPFESPNTPDPSESVFIDDRQVKGSKTVLMRGDQPAKD